MNYPPVKKREIWGWAMYDFANSSYTTVIITAIYSGFFTQHIVPKESATRDSYWSLAIILSTLVAMFLSPLAGAIADLSGRKMRFLIGTTLVCSLSTSLLFFVKPGDIASAIFLIAISNAAFMISETFCASFLTDISNSKNIGKISGIGWAIGYFGGLSSLILVQLIVVANPESDLANYLLQNRQAMLATGVFFLVAALPTFLFVKTRSKPAPGFEKASLSRYLSAGLKELSNGFATAREHKVLFQFLLAFMVYMAGLDAIIKFVGIYARSELNFGSGDIIKMFLILQIFAAIGAFGFGFLEAKIGPKSTVMSTLVLWIVAILAIFSIDYLSPLLDVSPKNLFLGIAIFAGLGLGSTQSSSRTVVGLLVPPEKSAELFGFWGFFARIATLLGMSFGFASDLLGSRRWAMLLVVAFFAVGLLMLSRIPLSKGIKSSS